MEHPCDNVTETIEPDPADAEDARRMIRVRDGDIAAFAEIVDRHRRRVETYLYRRFGDRDRASDGAQEVFVKLWMARSRYEPKARFTTFLYRIAHGHAVDEARRAGSRPAETRLEDDPDEGPAFLAPAESEPLRALFAAHLQARIRRAIAGLPEGQRSVFILGRLEERSIAEIAEILEIPEGTVKSRMNAAVTRLRQRLASELER